MNKLNFLAKGFCSKSSFKNKIPINLENIKIIKNLTFFEVKLENLDKTNLIDKGFYFEPNTNIKEIVTTIEKEYDILLDIKPNDLSALETQLAYEKYDVKKNNFLAEIDGIKKLLNINEKDPEYKEFLQLFNETKDINDLKRQYMIVNTEIEQLDKIKNLVDKKVSFRLNVLLLLLLSALIFITGVFYHCIYNIDELGWDLVEPTTYLFSSVVLLICLFGFIKLQKGFYSTTDMYYDLYNSSKVRRYIKYNFNHSKYHLLLKEKSKILKEIEKQSRI